MVVSGYEITTKLGHASNSKSFVEYTNAGARAGGVEQQASLYLKLDSRGVSTRNYSAFWPNPRANFTRNYSASQAWRASRAWSAEQLRLAPRDFEFPFQGSLTSTFLAGGGGGAEQLRVVHLKGARPVHLIITMIKWVRTSRLSIKNSLWASRAWRWRRATAHDSHCWRLLCLFVKRIGISGSDPQLVKFERAGRGGGAEQLRVAAPQGPLRPRLRTPHLI